MRGVFFATGNRSEREPTLMQRLVDFGVRWALLSVAVWVAAWVVDGVDLDGWESALLVGLILAVVHTVVRPVLLLVSLPITCLTLGFFLIIINTGMLALTAWIAGKFDRIHFHVDTFWDAFIGALIISVVAWFLGLFVRTPRRN